MINLARFQQQYVVELTEVEKGRTVMQIDMAEDSIENGMIKEELEDNGIKTISKTEVEIEDGISTEDFFIDGNVICNIYVNGIIVKDLQNELGL